MTEKPEKRKIDKYSVMALLVGIALIAAGIIGIITSRTESREYKNSTDIRKVEAVIDEFSTNDDKDDNGRVSMTTYKFDISYNVDGTDYKGKYEKRVYARDTSEKYYFDKLRRGDTISVEVYKTQKGSYKVSPEGNPVYFLLYCAAIPVGVVVFAVATYETFLKKPSKENDEAAAKSQGHGSGRRESDL